MSTRLYLSSVLGAFACFIALAGMAHGQAVTGEQIGADWTGKEFSFASSDGAKGTISFMKEGKVSLSVSGGGFRDDGTWRTTGDGYCSQWKKMRGGREECYKVERAESAYRVLKLDGKLDATYSPK